MTVEGWLPSKAEAKEDAFVAWNRRATPPSPSTAPEATSSKNVVVRFDTDVDERAAFEAWTLKHGGMPLDLVDDSLVTDDGLALPTFKFGRTEIAWRAWHAALASRPAEVDDEGLPPLPKAFVLIDMDDSSIWGQIQDEYWENEQQVSLGVDDPLFTAEQYRQGQRDAVAADRRGASASTAGGAVEKPQVVQDWRELGYVVGATVRQEIGLGRYDDAVITHAERNSALDVEMNGRAYGWSAQFCKVVAAPTEKKAES